MKEMSLSVFELVNSIKLELESTFKNVIVEGEISNLSLSSSGHWYLTLSDKEASLSAAVFKMDALRNPLITRLKDGDKVLVQGDINVYPKRGSFQIIIKKIVPKGVGDLKEKFEKLKLKLSKEGLFDITHKKKIPEMPKRIAVITALRGAALQDFLNIYTRRSFFMDIVIIPTLVQGDDAPKALRKSLFNAIKYSMAASENKKIDLVVITRGGGSMEDLWAFNDEGLAYDIFNCPIPIISAVGHEVDYSICDFVSDLRLETPSAAAETLTQKQTLILTRLKNNKNRLTQEMRYFIQRKKEVVRSVQPRNVLNILVQKLSIFSKKLESCNLKNRFFELAKIYDYRFDLEDKLKRLQFSKDKVIQDKKLHLIKMHELLIAYNPENVLKRGYSYLQSGEQVILNTEAFDLLKESDALKIKFYDGDRLVRPVKK